MSQWSTFGNKIPLLNVPKKSNFINIDPTVQKITTRRFVLYNVGQGLTYIN